MRRMACWAYEGVLMFGVVFIAGYLFSSLTQTRHALDNRHALQFFIFIVAGIYFVWLWSRGQTLAMKTWRIQVLDIKGRPLSQQRALVRYALSWLWFLPGLASAMVLNLSASEAVVISLGWIAIWAVLSRFHPRQQFWHDALAGTQLVCVEPGHEPVQ
ncbi:MAG: RDD family protein [Rhodoferax sp.]|nr:RDD family protein [Rhodoferax sp.]